MLDAATTEAVVEDYSLHHSVEDRLALSAAILKLSGALPSDAELERALDRELGSSYVPSLDGISAAAWLQNVAAQLTRMQG